MALSNEDVREILRIIDTTPLAELRIETEGFSLQVLRQGPAMGDAVSRTPEMQGVRETASPTAGGEPGGGTAAVSIAASAASAAPGSGTPASPGAADPPAGAAPADGLLTVQAPMLGIFYRAESPGQPPFVEVGSRVEPDTTVCIIEVMKMMNSVPAGVSGTIVEVCEENAGLVEYAQPLFRVQPE